MRKSTISVKGARVHNLKDIDVDIPKEQFVVITGLSGSGKSSLAFDTVYAEGQRQYVESLSSYAKQFFGVLDKPDVNTIDGLSPTIAIDQKSVARNPRSTVGTMTEVYDLLRLLFSRVGLPHCPHGHGPMDKKRFDEIVDLIQTIPADQEIVILSPIIRQKKGPYTRLFKQLQSLGHEWISVDDHIHPISSLKRLDIDPKIPHKISAVLPLSDIQDDFGIQRTDLSKKDIMDAVKTALDLSNGFVDVFNVDTQELNRYCQFHVCQTCGYHLDEIEPRHFSFNSPLGACEDCSGLGVRHVVDPELIMPNETLTLSQGAIRPWSRASSQQWYNQILEAVAQEHGFSVDTPVSELSKEEKHIILYGTGTKTYDVPGQKTFPGVIADLEERFSKKDSEYMRKEMGKYMRVRTCPSCQGKRLKEASLAITINGQSISDISQQTIEEVYENLKILPKQLTANHSKQIATPILEEMDKRLSYLLEVGLGYLSLDRSLDTLSGGELQRMRLATQMVSQLSGVIYVLDEPSIGLHESDTKKLIEILKQLKARGNSILVVEHDTEIMKASDHIIDMGPGAGVLGGKVIAEGPLAQIMKTPASITGKYLSGKRRIEVPKKIRKGNGNHLVVHNATEHNLKDVTVTVPLGKFVCVTGVSGSGKSSLVHDVLAKALHQKLYRATDEPGQHKEIVGIESIDKVITVDQTPIGRTPRSNPATYSGVFTLIRDLYASLPEAKMRGYRSGDFSFNVKGGGRCEACQGEGYVNIEMQFLPNVYVMCEQCKGTRYRQDILDIFYKDKHIADVLNMTIQEAKTFFSDQHAIKDKLQVLEDVGLGYMRLGQPATNLSGGEAQRVKLATELSRRATGKTLYILDEPTTGLHFEDIKLLLEVMQRLVDKGNSVIMIEHNLDVIKSADWIIDMGPVGGPKGGYIMAQGTPSDVKKVKKSVTGSCLSAYLANEKSHSKKS